MRLLPEPAARVTIPRGGTIAYAIEFARKNTPWLQRQLQRAPSDWADGSEVYFRGVPYSLRVASFEGGVRANLGGHEFCFSSETALRGAMERELRRISTSELIARALELAKAHGLEIRSVQVRDQRSRWGSCSTRRTISLNWRLIQTPEYVRDYIIVHELMHLKEMNHSDKFWGHVAAAFPGYLEAECWLKTHARLLR